MNRISEYTIGKAEFAALVANQLRKDGKGKKINIKRRKITITDEDGNSSDFYFKQERKKAKYTVADVSAFLDAMSDCAVECVKNGYGIMLPGFGKVSLKRENAKNMHDVNTGEIIRVNERYVARIHVSSNLSEAAKQFTFRKNYEEGKAPKDLEDKYFFLDEYDDEKFEDKLRFRGGKISYAEDDDDDDDAQDDDGQYTSEQSDTDY